jgi:hypothetical protein
VSATLFLALVGVYVLSTVGIVVVGTLVEPERDAGPEAQNLEQRLAVVRATRSGEGTTEAPPPYFAGTTRRN